jgi:fused signal recognition particle receptor
VFDNVSQPATNGHRPHVTLIVGVNGTGKTTTIGKLANLLKSQGKEPLVCAADTFRAAAVEQLEIWANARVGGHRRAKDGSIRRRRVSMPSSREGARTRPDSRRHRRSSCTTAST